jgi:DUF1365 family protein
MPIRDWLYSGTVLHRRLRPKANAFRYAVFFLRFPLDRIDELPNLVFSVNRFNLLSFHFADHGDGRTPRAWIGELLAAEGIHDADGEIVLQTFPRVLGFVFNPVSFWYCHGADGTLRAILAEVNNTFGERHCYLLRAGEGLPIRQGQELAAAKVFHVSPFCRIEGGYRFRFHEAARDGARQVVARIDYHDAEGALLLTSVSGRARAFSAPALIRAFITHPLMTMGVVARIHWQAARLFLKGVPFVRKPAPPAQLVTR